MVFKCNVEDNSLESLRRNASNKSLKCMSRKQKKQRQQEIGSTGILIDIADEVKAIKIQ